MADAFDLLTLDEAKGVLSFGAFDTTYDAELARVITGLSRRFDDLIGPTVQRTVTTELHDGVLNGCVYRSAVIVRKRPVASWTSVVEYGSGDSSGTALVEETVTTAGGFIADRYEPDGDLYSGTVRRRQSGADTTWAWGRGNLSFTYVAGRSVSTGAVDERIKEACAVALKNWWRLYEPSVGTISGEGGEFSVPTARFPTFTIPHAARGIVRDLLQPEISFGV